MSALVDEDKIAGLLDQLDKGSLKELLIRGRDDNTSNDNWVQGRITVDGLNFKVTYEDNDVETYPPETTTRMKRKIYYANLAATSSKYESVVLWKISTR